MWGGTYATTIYVGGEVLVSLFGMLDEDRGLTASAATR